MKRAKVKLTKLFEQLVALVENEMLDRLSVQRLVPHERVQSSRSSNNDMRTLVLALERLNVVLDRRSSVKHTSPQVGHELRESSVFVLDLVGEFSSVAEDDDRHLAVDGFDLLKRGEDEDGRLSHSRLGLAEDIHAEDRLGDTLLLNCRKQGDEKKKLVTEVRQGKVKHTQSLIKARES